MPFLPGICRKLFGEEIKLPFVETWWLSQADVRRRVLDELHRYVLLSAFGRDPLLPIRCSSLSPAARTHLSDRLRRRLTGDHGEDGGPFVLTARAWAVKGYSPRDPGRAAR